MMVDKYSKPPAIQPLHIGAEPVFRISCPVLAIALFAGGLSVQMARAQTPAPSLVPHTDLNASLDGGPDQPAIGDIEGGIHVDTTHLQQTGNNDKLFNDLPPEE